MKKSLFLVLLITALFASAAERFVTMQADTAAGSLEGWVWAESEGAVGGGPSKAEITLNKKLIGTEDNIQSIQYTWGYPDEQAISIAILSLQLPPEQNCEASFVLVDLTKENLPVITQRFGNCSAKPKVRYKFGQVVAYFPAVGTSVNKREIAYVYENGVLRVVTVTSKVIFGTWTEPL